MTAATDDLAAHAHALLDAAHKAGAEAADALAVTSDSVSVGVRGGALEEADGSESLEIGLRVLMGNRQACVSASDTRPETLAAMAERAVAMAREAPEDPHIGLAEPGELARDWDLAALDLVDDDPDPDPARLQADALACEPATSPASPRSTRPPPAGRAAASISRPPTASRAAMRAAAMACPAWRSPGRARGWSATASPTCACTAPTC
jgi:PmbA protein